VSAPFFLIDECLSPRLIAAALARGFEASHVAYFGLAGKPDWQIVQTISKRDTAFVTNHRRDFLKLFGRAEMHNGIVIIVPSVSWRMQKQLFDRALDVVETLDDTINRVIEVAEDGTVAVRDWPSPA
jgi:predicted nuclease of predicted toxin-antitoxin system